MCIRDSLKTFTPGNIEVLTTWQGNLIYCILMVICLFTLNYQQRRFIEFKKETLFPINANLESTTNKVKTTTDSNHAELREKSRKELSPSRTNWLNSVFNPFLKRPKVGVLKIEIFGKPKTFKIIH